MIKTGDNNYYAVFDRVIFAVSDNTEIPTLNTNYDGCI